MEHNFDIAVQKYGGSSVAGPHKIMAVARFIEHRLKSTERLCIVVSAMGDTTNELLSLAHQVNSDPPKRELDMLLSCGERSSMALLAMALDKRGIKALSLTGSQSGIITNDCHSGAELVAVRPQRVLEAFKTHRVVIIAGFQGMSRSREITTLARGGSDTTAVAITAALKARVCEIYSDAQGVMSIDPRISSYAKTLPALSFEQACALSLYGARILAHDAALLAANLNIDVSLAQSGDTKTQTYISEMPIKSFTRPVLSISHLRALLKLELALEDLALWENSYLLCGAWRDNKFIAYASNDIAQELASSPATIQAGLALMTVHVAHQKAMGDILKALLNIFQEHKLTALDIMIGRSEIFVILSEHELKKAMLITHQTFFEQEH